MHSVRKHNQSAKESATKPVRDHGTQSEVTKRTIGTMCGPVAIRHFNNETESQPPPPPTTTQISSSRHQQQSPQRSLHDIERDYQRHETQYRPQTPRRNTRADDKHDEEQLSPSFERQRPPSRYDTNTNTRLPPAANQSEDLTSNRHPQPSSTSKDDQCGPAQSYDNHSPSSFSTSNNYSSKKKHQPAKTSVETDTRYDGMKPQRDQGVQSETRSVRHNGTSTNTEEKPRHPDPLNRPTRPVVVKPQDGCILLTCDPPRPKPGVIPLHPEKNDGYVGNYDPVDNGNGSNNQSNTSTIYGDKIYIDQKPKPTIVPLSYGHQHKTPPMRESPTLNIGTENFIRESPDNEFTTPLERDYIEDPNRSFHIDNRNDPTSHKKRVVLLRVLNSAQTYVFEQQPSSNKNVHQSRTNKNFLLASSPTMQSFNSPARIHDSRTNQTSSNDFTGRHLASQNA
ncbi:hypothetical protein I4U23_029139 [Adineta vaga]|nr:hypothetical protein I4U23_029139 [Adineta vaga]